MWTLGAWDLFTLRRLLIADCRLLIGRFAPKFLECPSTPRASDRSLPFETYTPNVNIAQADKRMKNLETEPFFKKAFPKNGAKIKIIFCKNSISFFKFCVEGGFLRQSWDKFGELGFRRQVLRSHRRPWLLRRQIWQQ